MQHPLRKRDVNVTFSLPSAYGRMDFNPRQCQHGKTMIMGAGSQTNQMLRTRLLNVQLYESASFQIIECQSLAPLAQNRCR